MATIKSLAETISTLEARVAALEAAAQAPLLASRRATYASCKTPEERAAYRRQFMRDKAARKNAAALRAPVPGESPSIKAMLEMAAELHGVPVHELTFRGGKVLHKGNELLLG